jgi:anti-sigma-K factor RskA
MTGEEREQVGEYVLGLLEGTERAAFEQRLLREPALRAAVDRLQEHMGRLDDTAHPLPPNPELWQRIAGQLDAPHPLVTAPTPANDNRWRGWAGIAASMLVALGIGYLAGATLAQPQQPVMIAVLLTEDGAQPGALVEAFSDDSIRLVPLELAQKPEDRVYQVWTLPDPATGPVSMGIFDDPETIRLAGPQLPPPESGQLYEITLEPLGGSPTGRPTGPILVKGFAKQPF